MVVQHGQRVAASAIRQRQPPFEVHLPEQIRCSLLKPLTRRRASRRHNNATVSAQNLMHRRERRRLHALALKAACDLAGPPGGMRDAQRQYAPFQRPLRPPRARVRTPRAIRKLLIGSPAAKPLVPSGGMNLEPPAQLAPVCPLLHRKLNKLTPLVHDRHLLPRHGWPPWQPNPCNDDVSAMSPNTRRGCLRAIHLSRPSTSLMCGFEDVDARAKRGHDDPTRSDRALRYDQAGRRETCNPGGGSVPYRLLRLLDHALR